MPKTEPRKTTKAARTTTAVFVLAPNELKRRFKSLCARKGVSMSRALTDYMRAAVTANLLERS